MSNINNINNTQSDNLYNISINNNDKIKNITHKENNYKITINNNVKNDIVNLNKIDNETNNILDNKNNLNNLSKNTEINNLVNIEDVKTKNNIVSKTNNKSKKSRVSNKASNNNSSNYYNKDKSNSNNIISKYQTRKKHIDFAKIGEKLSLTGSNCHYCKSIMTVDNNYTCKYDKNDSETLKLNNFEIEKRNCKKSFCYECLKRYFPKSFLNRFDKTWLCPCCYGDCSCNQCKKSLKKRNSNNIDINNKFIDNKINYYKSNNNNNDLNMFNSFSLINLNNLDSSKYIIDDKNDNAQYQNNRCLIENESFYNIKLIMYNILCKSNIENLSNVSLNYAKLIFI